MIIDNMKVGTKLFSAFGLVIIFVALMVIVTEFILTDIKNKTVHVEEESLPYTLIAEEMTLASVQVQQWLTDVSATHNRDGYKDAEHSAETFLAGLAKFKEMFTSENETDSLNKVKDLGIAFDQYYTTGKHMAETYINQGLDAGNEIMEEFDVTANTLTAKMESLKEEQVNEIKSITHEIRINTEKAGKVLYLSAAVVLFIGIATSIFITRSLTGPISKGVNFAERMSGGDLTQTMKIDQKDEIGVLAESLNDMSSHLRTMFKDISSGVQTLSSTSTELSAISNQMATNSEQTTGTANSVAAAAEEMSVNMESVAAASEETSVNVNMVAAAAEEMTATISEIASNTEKTRTKTEDAVTQSKNASSQINELGVAAQEIGKVTEAITEISEQTNLLALNATIEAARAGEAGKGFAVVANEIKDLAKQTSEATREIKDKISGIQNASSNSVSAIAQIAEIISEINEMIFTVAATVEEQSKATQEISDNISQASQGIQEVNENVAQASSVTGEVATDIAQVGQASSEINASSTLVNTSAKELSELAEKLTGMVNQFKV